MLTRRGLLGGNRGETPHGDIATSETTRPGFRLREPKHETPGVIKRWLYAATIATAMALGASVATTSREVEATPIRVRGIEVETVELSDSLDTLLEDNGRATRMIMNGQDMKLLNSPGNIRVIADVTDPERSFSLFLPLPDNRTPQNMAQQGFSESPTVRNTWVYGVRIEDLEQVIGRRFQSVMLVREDTVDDGEQVRNFFAIPTQDEQGRIPIVMMVGNQPTYYAYCLSYYSNSQPDQSPVWSGRVLLYNRGDADPASAISQR